MFWGLNVETFIDPAKVGRGKSDIWTWVENIFC
jgi:hypothetical protein